MLSKLLKMYYANMLYDVRSPTPHVVGPPGVGKSETVKELAQIVGKKLHTVNVARLSPLEIEGVKMPVDGNTRLELLHDTLWSGLQEGDIVFLDEFLRGFPEVYNGFLDIMTSRHVAGLDLPKVFFVAASNSVTTYDAALTDRLMHLPVPDLRKNFGARNEAKDRMVAELGLLPSIQTMPEMEDLFQTEIVPMYAVLDQFTNKSAAGSGVIGGKSMRNLIGQVKLREVESRSMRELLTINNRMAMQQSKAQYVVLANGNNPDPEYIRLANKLNGSPKLTPLQQQNLTMNLQLIEMQQALAGTPSTTETTSEREDTHA